MKLGSNNTRTEEASKQLNKRQDIFSRVFGPKLNGDWRFCKYVMQPYSNSEENNKCTSCKEFILSDNNEIKRILQNETQKYKENNYMNEYKNSNAFPSH